VRHATEHATYHATRHAPPVSQEWPAEPGSRRPSPWLAFLLLTGALVAIALQDPDPLQLLAAAVVTYAVLSVVADLLRRAEARQNARGTSLLPRRFRGTRARVVLLTSVTAIREGEDPRAVAERLRSVPVEGRGGAPPVLVRVGGSRSGGRGGSAGGSPVPPRGGHEGCRRGAVRPPLVAPPALQDRVPVGTCRAARPAPSRRD